jgi:hypothetical protein
MLYMPNRVPAINPELLENIPYTNEPCIHLIMIMSFDKLAIFQALACVGNGTRPS